MKFGAFGEVMIRLTTADHLLLTQTNQLDLRFTGTGLNVLSGLSQFGDQGYLMTSLPANHVGQAAAAGIRHLGIHDDHVHYQGDHMGIYFLEKGLGGRPSYVTYLNRHMSSFCQGTYSETAFDAFLDTIDALHFCGISLAINETLSQTVLKLARSAVQKKIPVIFDCNYRSGLWQGKDPDIALERYRQMMALADIVFVSVRDCDHLGIPTEQRSEPEILQAIKEQFQLKILFGTHRCANGYQGYLLDDQGYLDSRIYPLVVFDRIGAGDAFAAGAIYGYFHEMDRNDLIDFATASGVLAHTTYGDSPVLSKAEIDDFRLHGQQDLIR